MLPIYFKTSFAHYKQLPYAIFRLIDIVLQPAAELDYLLLVRQEFIEHMQLSPAYLKMPDNQKNRQRDQRIDKLVAQLPNARVQFDWKLFPAELRPKLVPGKLRKKVVKQVDVNERYNNTR